MKNKRLLRTIAALTLSAAAAVGCFSMTACKSSCSGGQEPEHVHTFATEWESNATEHWHKATCEHTDEVSDKAAHIFEGDKCTVCEYVKEYENVTTVADLEAALKIAGGSGSGFKAATDITVGRFTFGAGVYFESSSSGFTGYVVNNQQKKISFELRGVNNENSIKFDAKGGSSGDLKLYSEDGTVVKDFGTITDIQKDLTATGLAAGNYYLQSKGSVRLGNISITEKLEKSSAVGIEISGGTRDYLAGSALDTSGLSAMLVYANGRKDVLSANKLTIDQSAFNKDVAGVYTITVKYKDNESFQATYNVSVFAAESLTVGKNAVIQGSNTMAGNGQYINHALRQFYLKGETLSTDGMSVTANASVTPAGGKKQEKTFIIKSGYTVSQTTLNTAGKQTISVTLNANTDIKGVFDVYVANYESLDLSNESAVTLNVNPETTTGIGEISNNAYQFATIQQALDFLSLSNVSDSATKTINLAAGTYKEKIEIAVPNLTIVGAGREDTIIEWDSLYGVADESGFVHTTDSTQTVAIREKAKGFQMKDLTVSNAYNSLKYFDETLGAGYGEHRALAILIQADKVVIDNCAFLGYQDTIELFTGRQYIKNSYISGTTDFIFGTNNTTYFENCEIHSVSNGKTDGGYITAFKGYNKDESDAITYGAIFDKCNFTADSDVVKNKNTAIGRPWGEYAAVAVINSTLDGHISTAGYTANTAKNQRYVAMSGVAPDIETVKFYEYKNTGDGKIDTAVAGMKFLSDTDAAKYSDKAVIFGKTNGEVEYSDDWDGSAGATITEKTYDFTECPANLKFEGTSGEYNGVAIDASKGKFAANGNNVQINTGTIIKIPMADSYKIIIDWYSGYEGTPKITYKDGVASIEFKANTYIFRIRVDLTQTEDYSVNDDDGVTVNESYRWDFNVGSAGAYSESISTTGELDKLSVKGSFTPNSSNWYIIGVNTELTLKIKSGTTVDYYLHSALGVGLRVNDGNTEAVTPVMENGGNYNGLFKVSYTATEDCEITLIATSTTSSTYIRYIVATVA